MTSIPRNTIYRSKPSYEYVFSIGLKMNSLSYMYYPVIQGKIIWCMIIIRVTIFYDKVLNVCPHDIPRDLPEFENSRQNELNHPFSRGLTQNWYFLLRTLFSL